MSIAEKMIVIAENTQRVYEAGQGEFWDRYQDKGNRTNYDYAFAGDGWTDEIYNPQYPINAESFANMFLDNSKITNTKVPIVLGNNSDTALYDCMFMNCHSLVTIPSLQIEKNTKLFGSFDYCESLEHIGFRGEIWCDIYFQESAKLTDETLIQLVHTLKDFKNDEENQDLYGAFGIYLENDVSSHLWEITMDERSPEYDGMILAEVVMEKGWSI